ncbi:hypothetical protein AVEN_48309-1 [Araneus ventricosus]|uniref:Uncharacterized protein n=1 Tax=Araneus ventricosus TaxID=182803 RepID=A0A4Y2N7G7_ARAVE|nr:hypothetical protein AVEN_48309-1 [Araneus ventricosus]
MSRIKIARVNIVRTGLSRSYQGEFTRNAIDAIVSSFSLRLPFLNPYPSDLRGVAEELILSDLSASRTNHPTAIQRPPSRLIIGSGQHVTPVFCRLFLCGRYRGTALALFGTPLSLVGEYLMPLSTALVGEEKTNWHLLDIAASKDHQTLNLARQKLKLGIGARGASCTKVPEDIKNRPNLNDDVIIFDDEAVEELLDEDADNDFEQEQFLQLTSPKGLKVQ